MRYKVWEVEHGAGSEADEAEHDGAGTSDDDDSGLAWLIILCLGNVGVTVYTLDVFVATDLHNMRWRDVFVRQSLQKMFSCRMKSGADT